MNQKKRHIQDNNTHACVHNDIYLSIPQQRQLAKRATLKTKNGSQNLPVLLNFYWLLLRNLPHFYWLVARLAKRLSIGIFTPVSGLYARWKWEAMAAESYKDRTPVIVGVGRITQRFDCKADAGTPRTTYLHESGYCSAMM